MNALVRLLAPRSRLGAKPQADMLGLHGGTDYPHQLVAQGAQVRLVTQPDVEGGESLCGVVLPSVKASIHEALHPTPERVEQCGYRKGGRHDCEGRSLTRERAQW